MIITALSLAAFYAAITFNTHAADKNRSEADSGEIYYERCGTCHRAYEPDTYTAAQWENIVTSMKIHSGVTPQEEAQIMRYLIRSAKQEK